MDDWLYDEIKRWLVLEFLNLSSESYFALFDFFIAYVKMYILVLLSISKKNYNKHFQSNCCRGVI